MKDLKTLTLMLVMACMAMVASAQTSTGGMEFEKEGTLFQQAVVKAKSTGKLIFLDCYTSWCGPCKKMARDIFPQEKVGSFMNPKYVCIKIDMEKGEGPELAKKLQVSAFPTFIIFNSAGQELGRFLGGCEADDFIAKVTKASEDNSSADMDKRFADGERSEAFLWEYLNTLGSAYKRSQCNTVVEELLKGKAETFASDKELANAFMRYLTNPYNEAFLYTVKHPETLKATVGDVPVDMKIRNVWQNYMRELISEKDGKATIDTEKMADWLKLMKDNNVDEATRKELALTAYMTVNQKSKDWAAYMQNVEEYVKELDATDLMLCKWCSPVAKECTDAAPRATARKLLQQRLDDLKSGKRAPQTMQGNMRLSGNLDRAMQMLIDTFDGKEINMEKK